MWWDLKPYAVSLFVLVAIAVLWVLWTLVGLAAIRREWKTNVSLRDFLRFRRAVVRGDRTTTRHIADKYIGIVPALLVGLLMLEVACQRGESPTQPGQPVATAPVSGPQWVLAAGSGGVQVYYEIFLGGRSPNYAKTFLFWDTDQRKEIGRISFTIDEKWSVNFVRPSRDFQVTPDGTRLGVHFAKSGKFYDQYRVYDLRRATDIHRTIRSTRDRPFIVDSGSEPAVVLGNRTVTITLLESNRWSESRDTEDPLVYGTFFPPEDQTFPIPIPH